MTKRTIGIDLAIRGDHVAQIYDDGRPFGRPIRFRHDPPRFKACRSLADMRDLLDLARGSRGHTFLRAPGEIFACGSAKSRESHD